MKILIRDAIKVKEGFLYYIDGEGNLCLASTHVYEPRFDSELRKCKYHFNKYSFRTELK